MDGLLKMGQQAYQAYQGQQNENKHEGSQGGQFGIQGGEHLNSYDNNRPQSHNQGGRKFNNLCSNETRIAAVPRSADSPSDR